MWSAGQSPGVQPRVWILGAEGGGRAAVIVFTPPHPGHLVPRSRAWGTGRGSSRNPASLPNWEPPRPAHLAGFDGGLRTARSLVESATCLGGVSKKKNRSLRRPPLRPFGAIYRRRRPAGPQILFPEHGRGVGQALRFPGSALPTQAPRRSSFCPRLSLGLGCAASIQVVLFEHGPASPLLDFDLTAPRGQSSSGADRGRDRRRSRVAQRTTSTLHAPEARPTIRRDPAAGDLEAQGVGLQASPGGG